MSDTGGLTHLDETGAARMVEVGAKEETRREATLAKGDALGVARVAGIMAAKRTPELIPLCHPLPISGVEVSLEVLEDGVRVEATARVTARTGVEMEALTAAAVAGLTLIDMVKAVEKGVTLERVRLLAKRGGRSGEWSRGGG